MFSIYRQNEEQHNMITKTDAKTKYLLRDADFDVREPPLKFISRKNPHHKSWGEMKLFYEPQVGLKILWSSLIGIVDNGQIKPGT